MSSIEQVLRDRIAAMAAHDGQPAGAGHIVGAANQLQSELLAARDGLMRAPAPLAVPESQAIAERAPDPTPDEVPVAAAEDPVEEPVQEATPEAQSEGPAA